jgi:hypothetical protein
MTYHQFKKIWDEFQRLDREAELYTAALLSGSPDHVRGMQAFYGRMHLQVRPLMDQMSAEFRKIEAKLSLARPLTSDEMKINALRHQIGSTPAGRNWQAELSRLLSTPGGRRWYADTLEWLKKYR